MLRTWRLDALLLLAILGVGIAAYLTWIAFSSNEAFCTGVGDCHRVQNSEYAKVAGVPVALLGLGMYGTLLAILGLRRFTFGVVPTRPLEVWTVALTFAGMLYSGYLTYLELFVIDAICIWCVVSAVVVTVMWLLAVPDMPARAGPSSERAV